MSRSGCGGKNAFGAGGDSGTEGVRAIVLRRIRRASRAARAADADGYQPPALARQSLVDAHALGWQSMNEQLSSVTSVRNEALLKPAG